MVGGRRPQIEALVRPRQIFSLKMKDKVSGGSVDKGGAICIHEMSIFLACLKISNFQQEPCAKELSDFQKCVATHQKRATTMSLDKKSMKDPKNLQRMFERFPNK